MPVPTALQKSLDEMRTFLDQLRDGAVDPVAAISEVKRMQAQITPELQKELQEHASKLYMQQLRELGLSAEYQRKVAILQRQLEPFQILCTHDGPDVCSHCGAINSEH